MTRVQHALQDWMAVIGFEHVITDPQAVEAAQTATFVTDNRILAITVPGNARMFSNA